MTHSHTHTHDDRSSYFLEQLCTIAICGALAGVGIMLWIGRDKVSQNPKDMMHLLLNPKFHLPVLLGAITLLVMVVVRAAAVWKSSGSQGQSQEPNHEHDYIHGHDQEHGHAHEHGEEHHHHAGECCGHDHAHDHEHPARAQAASNGNDHGHEHGWTPWRYAVLLLPVVLYFLNLPNKTFDLKYFGVTMNKIDVDEKSFAEAKGGNVNFFDLQELKNNAASEEFREAYRGTTGRMKGQFAPQGDKFFTLIKGQMNCCAADMVVVKSEVFFILKSGVKLSPEIRNMDWVEVEGQIQFKEKPENPREFMPIMLVSKLEKTS